MTDSITAHIGFQFLTCGFTPTTTITGNTVRTTISVTGCVIGPPGTLPRAVDVPFGPLPPGNYTYEVYFQFEFGPPVFGTQQALTVLPPPIPTVNSLGVIVLAVALSMAGILTMRRF